ncbi:DHHC palmitoyltransferase domain-containing protein [Ditylenchus destructor]|uniref:Palmitoyltransferase n=1 Tax=Ditylenchus destructor TaxID=166010 RepID=A0AAD4R527_9BILA|nr:DHHC palmitoyltransferase domain-containing protein [Ditylenchus destructor]
MSTVSSLSSTSTCSWVRESDVVNGENKDTSVSNIDSDDGEGSHVSTTTEEFEEAEIVGGLTTEDALIHVPSTSSSVSSESCKGAKGNSAPADSSSLIAIEEAPRWPTGLVDHHLDVGRTLSQRLFHIGPLSAIFIVLIIGFSTTLLHVSWWPITTPLGCLDLLVFLTWNYLVLHNLLKAAFVGGGYVPLGWHPEDEDQFARLQYCHKCNGFKVPRSHHCTKCNRCVMKMDHHCPWINNCVGHRNQVYFMRFLFFAVVGCAHGAAILSLCIWQTLSLIYWGDPRQPIHRSRFIIDSLYSFMAAVLAVSFAYGVIIAVGFLFFIQLRSAWRNKTGIEQYICMKAEYREADFVFPYDLGWRRNLAEMFNGGNAIARGNGIWWPTRSGCSQFTLTEEQLEQKRVKQEYYRRHPNREPPSTCWSRFSRRFIQPIYKKCV